jgi:hypothetical protein
MGAKIQAFDIFQTPLSSHYPLPLKWLSGKIRLTWDLRHWICAAHQPIYVYFYFLFFTSILFWLGKKVHRLHKSRKKVIFGVILALSGLELFKARKNKDVICVNRVSLRANTSKIRVCQMFWLNKRSIVENVEWSNIRRNLKYFKFMKIYIGSSH